MAAKTKVKPNTNSTKSKPGKSPAAKVLAGKAPVTKLPAGKTQLKEKPTQKRMPTRTTTKAVPAKATSTKSVVAVVSKPQRGDLDLEHFRDLLIDERTRLEDELEQVRNRHTDMDNALPEDGESGDEDTADLAAAMMDKEMDLSVEEEIEDILSQVDRALQKLDEGSYGICDVSGKEIPVNRLEAIPYATLTVECQSLSEF